MPIIKPAKPDLRIMVDVDSLGQVNITTHQANPFGGFYDKPTQTIHPLTHASIFSKVASACVDMAMQALAQGNKPSLEKPIENREEENNEPKIQ